MAFTPTLSVSSSSHSLTPRLFSRYNRTPTPARLKPPQFTNTLHPHLSLLSLSTSRLPLFHSLFTKPTRDSPFLLTASSAAEAPPTVETPNIDSESVEEDEVEVEEDENSRTRILAQNVPWSSTVDDIRPVFEKFGTVVDIELSMYNKNRNRGLAFVTMGSHEEALVAINNLESSEFEGRTLKLSWARPRKKKQRPNSLPSKPAPIHNLFVANLPFHARAKDLKEFFGNAASAEIIFHENPRRSAGYGFVSFYTKKEAEAALAAFQGKEFMGRAIRVATSKRFLRQGTKASLQGETESTELSCDAELSVTAD